MFASELLHVGGERLGVAFNPGESSPRGGSLIDLVEHFAEQTERYRDLVGHRFAPHAERRNGFFPRSVQARVGASLLAAVVLVCAIPLYARVAESAGLRHTLESDPRNLYITVHASNSLFSSGELDSVQQNITQELQSTLGSTVARDRKSVV